MRQIVAAAIVTIAGAALSTVDASPTEAALLSVGAPKAPAGAYQCADVANNSLTPLTAVVVFDCHGGTNQDFQFIGDTIYALSGQRCLDVMGAGTADFTPVDSYTCDGTVAQQFYCDNGQIIYIYGSKCGGSLPSAGLVAVRVEPGYTTNFIMAEYE